MTEPQQEGNLQDKLRSRMEFNFTLMNLLCPFIIIAAVYFLPFSHLLAYTDGVATYAHAPIFLLFLFRHPPAPLSFSFSF